MFVHVVFECSLIHVNWQHLFDSFFWILKEQIWAKLLCRQKCPHPPFFALHNQRKKEIFLLLIQTQHHGRRSLQLYELCDGRSFRNWNSSWLLTFSNLTQNCAVSQKKSWWEWQKKNSCQIDLTFWHLPRSS